MNYITNFIINFAHSFGELLEGTFGSLFSTSSGSLESTLPTVTTGVGTTTVIGGSMETSEDGLSNETLGTSSITTGSAVVSAANNNIELDVDLNTTQSYVESMSDEELEEFICKLENVNVEYDMDNISLSKRKNS